MTKIGFASLGCAKNLVDSERILTKLRADGYKLVGDYKLADLAIINTCGFIEPAIKESLQEISNAITKCKNVIVTGCLGKNAHIIQEKFPQVLAITGPDFTELIHAVHQHFPPTTNSFENLIPIQNIRLTPKHYAYLKIAEGCNNSCSFCIIPQLRGKFHSYPQDSIINSANTLVNDGIKELIIISQDTGFYGFDLDDKKPKIRELINSLTQFNVWLRLLYIYPYPHIDNLVKLMNEGKVLPYLDVPLQHASPSILRNMKRPASVENILKRIEKWRNICPDISIRSTFIVGYPGETKADFEKLLTFLKTAQIDRIGCFKYSNVKGAQSYNSANQIDEQEKQARWEILMEIQQKISANKLKNKIGKSLDVLIDSVKKANDFTKQQPSYQITGRTKYDAPDVDGVVNFTTKNKLKTGQIKKVVITQASEYDLKAEELE